MLVNKSNNFYRLLPPHPVSPNYSLDLNYNSYYLAGIEANDLLLANSTSPLNMLKIDLTTRDTSHLKIEVQKSPDIRLRKSVKVSVLPPYFFLMDGITPKLLRGKINDLYAQQFMYDSAYFNDITPISPNSFVIKALSSNSQENVLGKEFNTQPYVKLEQQILEKQIDGIFCTDGMLHYNKENNLLVYLYYYRNQYIVLDTTLTIRFKGNTIDTNSIAKIKPISLVYENSKVMAAPPLLVNRKSYSAGNFLLVESNLMAENENVNNFREVSVIDVYNLRDNDYKFSFYIYPFKKQRLSDFMLTENYFIGLHQQYLVIYDLDHSYFIKNPFEKI